MRKSPLTAFEMPLDASFSSLLDTNGKTCLALLAVSNAENYLTARNASAGTAPRLLAQGTDTNIGLRIDPKGTGTVTIGSAQVLTTASAIATDATARVDVALEGVSAGARRQINFLTGSNVTFNITDDAGNERVDVEISSSGGGGSGLDQDGVLTLMGWGGY